MRIEPTLRALADPTRLRIMRLLAAMELAVGELALVLGQSQPRVSRHVRILCDAGLAERRKEGSWVFLRSAIGEHRAPPLGAAAARLLALAEEGDAQFAARCGEDRRHLAAIRATREASAAAYFARHAAQWDEIRSLHSADGPVEAALQQALGSGGLGALLDVGTGTGRIAELLSPRAASVTGLDNSPEMLRLARARLQTLPAERIASVKGWKINLQVCYDLRFPVWARQQSQPEGPEYDVLIYVANWPERRNLAWKTLLQARAIENQCYVIGVNRVGNDGNGIYHSGDSMIIDPMGEILYHKKDEEDVFTISLDKEHVKTIREKLPFLKDADSFVVFNEGNTTDL